MAHLGHDLRKRLVSARATLPTTKWSLNTTDQAPGRRAVSRGSFGGHRRNYIEAARRGEAASKSIRRSRKHGGLFIRRSTTRDYRSIVNSKRFRPRSVQRSGEGTVLAPRHHYRVLRTIGDHERALVFYVPSVDRAASHRERRTFLPARSASMAWLSAAIAASWTPPIDDPSAAMVRCSCRACWKRRALRSSAGSRRDDAYRTAEWADVSEHGILFSALREWTRSPPSSDRNSYRADRDG